MNKIYIFLDARYIQTPDGKVWTKSKADSFFWSRYLKNYDQVNVVARIEKCETVHSSYALASANHVVFRQVGYYLGVGGYLKNVLTVRKNLLKIRHEIRTDNATVIFRLPISMFFLNVFRNCEYAVEVISEPFEAADVFVKNSWIRPILANLFRRKLKREVTHAHASSYVTSKTLQRMYPPAEGTFSTYYSSINLLPEDYSKYQLKRGKDDVFQLISVGSLEQMTKGPDVLIRCIKVLISSGLQLQCTWVGDGLYREKMQSLAKEEGVSEYITFVGFKPIAEIKELFKKSHLFVLASYTEGLPRAMLEAMANSLCVVVTDVGGSAEMAGKEYLCPAGDHVELAKKIEKCMLSENSRLSSGRRNYDLVQDFRSDLLNQKRNEFYNHIQRM